MKTDLSRIEGGAGDQEALAAAISEIGTPAFAGALLDAIQMRCSFDSALMVLYARRRRPDILIDRLSHARRENSAESYIRGAYLLDPFYARARRLKAPALLRMRDIAPEAFDASEYFVSYYKQSSVVDELNYLVPIADRRVVAIAFERSSLRPPFSPDDIENCTSLLPVVAALVTRHVTTPGAPLPPNQGEPEHDRLEAVLKGFGSEVLTRRECEVVQLMLSGYSASAIAGLLELSVETIRVHRRNIYEKLRISSLAELFSMALKAISAQATI